MARPGGNPLCVGKKGRSGRKSYRDEKLRTRVIEKAWLKKDDRMSDQDATQIVLKDMTQKTDVMSGGKPIFLPSEIIDKHKINESTPGTKDSSNGQAQV